MMNPEAIQNYYATSSKVRTMALVGVGFILIILAMSMSAINIAIPAIGADLNIDAEALSWIPTAMLWGNVVFLLPVGRMAER
ncbi:MAG: MFS transporter, partial [Pseudomonadales bacterium]